MWVPGGIAYLVAALVHAARILAHDPPVVPAELRADARVRHLARLPP